MISLLNKVGINKDRYKARQSDNFRKSRQPAIGLDIPCDNIDRGEIGRQVPVGLGYNKVITAVRLFCRLSLTPFYW